MVRPTPVQLRRHRMLPIAATTVLVVAASAGLASASTARPSTPGPSSGGHPSAANPIVTGPITGGSGAIVPANLNLLDLSKVGYQSAEFFLSGTASAYSSSAPLNVAGNWSVTPTSTAPYKTRVVVYRPIDPKKFNGTVIVEWLNVSGQSTPIPIGRRRTTNSSATGAVGRCLRPGRGCEPAQVSRQHLRLRPPCPAPGDPARYGTLAHPGDSYSYDIFSQAGQAIRHNSAQILGGLTPKKLLAAGESQSAGRMVTYIDAVQPLAHVYDGFLVHSRGGRVPRCRSRHSRRCRRRARR